MRRPDRASPIDPRTASRHGPFRRIVNALLRHEQREQLRHSLSVGETEQLDVMESLAGVRESDRREARRRGRRTTKGEVHRGVAQYLR